MARTPWKWNYFTLESLCVVKCSLCNDVYKPLLQITHPLEEHLRKGKDERHTNAHDECYKLKGRRKFRWDSHFEITSSNIVLKPNVKCTHCKVDIPVSSGNSPIIHAPSELETHLKNKHNIEFSNWKELEKWIYSYATQYIPEIENSEVIKVNRCKKCQVEIRAENAIMFVKHLIDEHRQEIEPFLHPNVIPEALLVFDSNDDIPTDSPTNDGSSKVKSTSSDQPTTSRQQQSKTIDKTSEEPSFDPNAPSSSGYASEEPPSKRKSNSPPQTEKHPSKRKK